MLRADTISTKPNHWRYRPTIILIYQTGSFLGRAVSVCVVTACRRPVQLSYLMTLLLLLAHVRQDPRANRTNTTCEVWEAAMINMFAARRASFGAFSMGVAHGFPAICAAHVASGPLFYIFHLSCWAIAMKAGHIRFAEERSIDACISCYE